MVEFVTGEMMPGACSAPQGVALREVMDVTRGAGLTRVEKMRATPAAAKKFVETIVNEMVYEGG